VRSRRLSKALIPGFLFLLLAVAAYGSAPAMSQTQAPRLEPNGRDRALERAAGLPQLRSLLVSMDGKVVEERYFYGTRPEQAANVKSVSKSLLSTLVGIALDRGFLRSVEQPIGKYFTEHANAAVDPAWQTITIEDLLTMRSGLETTSNRNYGQWVQSRNWVRHVLSQPMIETPGGRMIYSTGNSHLLSAILTKATGMSTFEFARRHLAEPMGIPIRPWRRDPQGIYFGGNEMYLTPRAMLEFGHLYLNGGLARRRQIVSETWVRRSLEPRTRSRWSGSEYGYGWWTRFLAGRQAHYAWGYGGQFVFIVPDLKLVVVTTSSPTPGPERREHRNSLYDLMEQELIPAADHERAAEKNRTGLS